MTTQESRYILENEEIHNVTSFKEASDLCDEHYDEWRNKSTGKVDSSFDECELEVGTLYQFYPPKGVKIWDYLYVLVKN